MSEAVARAILCDLDKATKKMEWAGLIPESERDAFDAVTADLKALKGEYHFESLHMFNDETEMKGFMRIMVDNFMHVMDAAELDHGLDDVEAYVTSHISDLVDQYRNFGFDDMWQNYRDFSWGEQMYQDLNGFLQEFNCRAAKDFKGLEQDIQDFAMTVGQLDMMLDREERLPDAGLYVAAFCDLSTKIERVTGEDQKHYRNYMLSIYGLG